MKQLILFIVAACLFSCMTEEKARSKYPCEASVSDTVTRWDTVHKHHYHHDTIYKPVRSVFNVEKSPCPPEVNYNKTYHDNGLTNTVTIKDGLIKTECKSDSLECVIADLEEKIITGTKVVTKTVVQEVNKVGWFDYVCRGLSLLFLLMLLALIFKK